MSKVLLQHDNARPHNSLKTCEVISSFGWTTISHPPYLPDLALSDFYLFGPSDEEVKNEEVNRKWLKMQPIEFYNKEICALVKRCKKSVWKAGDYIMK